ELRLTAPAGLHVRLDGGTVRVGEFFTQEALEFVGRGAVLGTDRHCWLPEMMRRASLRRIVRVGRGASKPRAHLALITTLRTFLHLSPRGASRVRRFRSPS